MSKPNKEQIEKHAIFSSRPTYIVVVVSSKGIKIHKTGSYYEAWGVARGYQIQVPDSMVVVTRVEYEMKNNT